MRVWFHEEMFTQNELVLLFAMLFSFKQKHQNILPTSIKTQNASGTHILLHPF